MTEQIKKVWYMALVAALGRGTRRRQTQTVHNYRHRPPHEYEFEQLEDENQAYMTSQGRGLVRGDYIVLGQNQQVKVYQIQTIDYYTSPSDMWVALLTKANLPQHLNNKI